MQKDRNISIQLLRIIACTGVFCVHFGQRVELEGIVRTFFDSCKYCVQLFFIISGLLAAKGLNNKHSVIFYYKKRIISILPLYYLVILWYFITENILNIFFHQIPPDILGLRWFRYIFILNGFIGSDTFFWSNIGGTWTIPVFAFFYLIAPLIMMFVISWKKAFWTMISAFVLTKILVQIYYCTIFDNIYYFFIGIFIYYCHKEKKLMLCSVGFLILTLSTVILGNAWYPGFFALLTCICLQGNIQLSASTQKVVCYLDEHSYTLYLVHGAVFYSIIDRIGYGRLGVPKSIIGIAAITLSLAGTVIVHKWIEKPTQNLLKEKMLHKI